MAVGHAAPDAGTFRLEAVRGSESEQLEDVAMHPEKTPLPDQPLACAAPTTPPPPLYSERFGLVTIVLNSYHLRNFDRCYRLFDGDLPLALVLGEIGLYHFAGDLAGANLNPGTQPLLDALLRDRVLVASPDPANASILSRATGIPRETVRRKIAGLLQRGWIAEMPSGGYRVTERTLDYFGYAFNLEVMNDFVATDSHLRAILELEPLAKPPWIECLAHHATDHRLPITPRTVFFSRQPPPMFGENPPWSAPHLRMLVTVMHGYNLGHFKRIYAAFGGDLILTIVLGEIAHFNKMAALSEPTDSLDQAEALLQNSYREGKQTECNAFSLSMATSIPRETVRRKIAQMVRWGWLERTARGGYVVTDQPSHHFSPSLNVEMLNDFLDTAARLRALMAMG